MTSTITNPSGYSSERIPRRSAISLSDALDTHLSVSPKVLRVRTDPCGAEKLALCQEPAGSIVRSIIANDRILTVVAIPGGRKGASITRRTLLRGLKHRDVLVVTESWLMRQPRLGTATEVAMCRGRYVAPLDRILVEQHLQDHGGSSCLVDCAAHVIQDNDPVSVVLSLVERGALRIDYSRPLSAHSRISLPTRRHSGRILIGG